MRRFLKKLSSLCLALVLSAGGLFNLNANATLEDISLEGLNAQGIAGVIEYWQENFSYTDIVSYFLVIWLKKIGKDGVAEAYEKYMEQNEFADLLNNPGKYIKNYNEIDKKEDRQKMLDLEMSKKVLAFFDQFTFHLNAREVGLYALIYNYEFALASDFVVLITGKTFEDAEEELGLASS